MAKQIGVQAGQQYVKAHSTRNPPPVWEVRSIYSGVGNIAHAGLMNPADPLDRKTVSFSALLDEKHYRLLTDVGPETRPANRLAFFLGSYVAGRLLDKGDPNGCAVWTRVLRAVEGLQGVGLDEGKTQH